MLNRYPGQCADCLAHVEAGKGVYGDRVLRCSTPADNRSVTVDGETVIVQTYCCERYAYREAKRIVKARAARAAYVPSPDEIAERAERAAKRAEQDARWATRGLARCDRCDGAGGSKSWPGFACYDCGGHGAVLA